MTVNFGIQSDGPLKVLCLIQGKTKNCLYCIVQSIGPSQIVLGAKVDNIDSSDPVLIQMSEKAKSWCCTIWTWHDN